MDNIKS